MGCLLLQSCYCSALLSACGPPHLPRPADVRTCQAGKVQHLPLLPPARSPGEKAAISRYLHEGRDVRGLPFVKAHLEKVAAVEAYAKEASWSCMLCCWHHVIACLCS